jgi:hypothetical protein
MILNDGRLPDHEPRGVAGEPLQSALPSLELRAELVEDRTVYTHVDREYLRTVHRPVHPRA